MYRNIIICSFSLQAQDVRNVHLVTLATRNSQVVVAAYASVMATLTCMTRCPVTHTQGPVSGACTTLRARHVIVVAVVTMEMLARKIVRVSVCVCHNMCIVKLLFCMI